MTLKIAVIGLGYFSQFHLRGWLGIENTEIVGVVDLVQERRRTAEELYGVRGFLTRKLLATVDQDIVDIVPPPPTHAALTRAAFRRGRLIVGQKPFCGDLETASTVAAEAAATGTTVVGHENFRFQPWHREIKRLLDRGDMGTPWQCTFLLRPGDGRGAKLTWRANRPFAACLAF
ncbi:Gfo/Idh/MocA family protein [Bradyrhizobium sp. USDA 336]|uniref:Gfo/Idh/MocA family protein n=1 Tax=Bradyrhizobium sp. USDA 336 TaxID=3156311 RepID=UPI003835108F